MKIYADCFADEEIKSEIISNSAGKDICEFTKNECDYVFSNDLPESLEDFFRQFFSIYEISANGKKLCDCIQQEWNMFNDTTECVVIVDAIAKDLGVDIRSNSIVDYVNDIVDAVDFWEEVKGNLMRKYRYFQMVEELSLHNWDSYLTSTTRFQGEIDYYRARINKNGMTEPFKKEEMGCPPSELATAGRANPAGIPYLYLSKDARTTLFETRCSYLDMVTIGRFRTKGGATITLVDFTKEGSPFNYSDKISETAGRLLRKRISADLSKPLSRYDTDLEYVPTQYICEYIRFLARDAQGILFNSSLCDGGINVVVFDQNDMECLDTRLCQVDKIDIHGRYLDNKSEVI